TAIEVDPFVQNIQIVDNDISIAASNGVATGIRVDGGQAAVSRSIVIANNHINTGGKGTGIEFAGGAPGLSFTANVEGNDCNGNHIGVLIEAGLGGSVSGIDLGGGAQGSKGANNFRGAGSGKISAIFVTASAAAGPVQAKMNIFGVADPTTAIWDQKYD